MYNLYLELCSPDISIEVATYCQSNPPILPEPSLYVHRDFRPIRDGRVRPHRSCWPGLLEGPGVADGDGWDVQAAGGDALPVGRCRWSVQTVAGVHGC